ncbi:MAG: hypothetical protein U0L72_11165 [Acutalibacteraceae bacterium]|nr:hypothetical protein [Acutalibacteraceae bacterium]
MSLTKKPKYIKEPTDLQCGQAVLAMLTDKSVDKIITECGTDRETTLAQMKKVLNENGINFSEERKEAKSKSDLPKIALLSLETPRCWHWSLYFDGIFYDPEHEIMNDFPICKRKYYWEIKKEAIS